MKAVAFLAFHFPVTEVVFVDKIFVSIESRRKKHGTTLMENLPPHERVELIAKKENKTALSFYASLNMRSSSSSFYDPHDNEILLSGRITRKRSPDCSAPLCWTDLTEDQKQYMRLNIIDANVLQVGDERMRYVLQYE